MWKVFALLAVFVGHALAQLPRQQQHVFDYARDPYSRAQVPAKRAITPDVAQLVTRLMIEASIPGLTIGVVHPDNSIELSSWGTKDERGNAMTTDTLFDIASCSKAFLAATLGILMDDFAQGRNQTALPLGVETFDWHTKIIDLLPDDWKLMDDWATRKATIRDVLSHQSGLPRHDFSYKPTDRAIDVLHRMQYLRPAFELRQRWHYNNQMYMLGAHLVSTYSGKTYPEYIKERIWGPLNMTSTTISPNEALQSGKRTDTWTASGRLIPFWFAEESIDLNAGPGGIISSAVDLTKWVRLLLNGGVDLVTNRTIIPQSAFEEITTVHQIVGGRASQPYFSIDGYGMGWSRTSYQGHEILDHGGAIPGISAETFVLPNDKLGIVALGNKGAMHKQELALIYRIIENYLKLDKKESIRLTTSGAQVNQASLSYKYPTVTISTTSAPLTLPLERYVGHYYDPGYGAFALCAPTPSPTPECSSILDAFAPFYSVRDPPTNSTPTLYTAISSTWISHLRLSHKDGDTFDLHGTFLFPNGYGKNKKPFQTEETGETAALAEFWVRDGEVVGLALNGFVGETTERQRLGGSIADKAEIWLQKL